MRRLLPSLLAVLVGVSLTCHSVEAQAPVPGLPPGFSYKSSPGDVPVRIESWVSLVCSDSKMAWMTYQQIVDSYGPDKVRFDALMFPLPYQRAAMAGAQSAFVAREIDATRVYDYFDNVFEKQAVLYDSAIYNKTEDYIAETYSIWAAEVGYDKSEFKSRLQRSDPTRWDAIVEFKSGGARGVYSTPQVYVNGALLFAGYDWTLDDWKEIIDPLLEDSGNSAYGLSNGVLLLLLATSLSTYFSSHIQ